ARWRARSAALVSLMPALAASVRVLQWVAASGWFCVVRRTISAASIRRLRPGRGKSASIAASPPSASAHASDQLEYDQRPTRVRYLRYAYLWLPTKSFAPAAPVAHWLYSISPNAAAVVAVRRLV